MSLDMATFVTKCAVVVDAFNHDDLEPLADILAERCEFTASGTRVGNTRDENVAALKQARTDGWLRHLPMSLTGAGEFVVSVFRNEYADGSSFVAAGIMRIDESGQICEIVSLDPPAVRQSQ
jgi:hypothetical protein